MNKEPLMKKLEVGDYIGLVEHLINEVERLEGLLAEKNVSKGGRAEIFALLTQQAADTYAKKNHDYGNSFVKVREKFPNSVLVRLNDKLSRLEVLMGGELAQVKDESIDDTLLDLANYALMELTERIYERGEPHGN